MRKIALFAIFSLAAGAAFVAFKISDNSTSVTPITVTKTATATSSSNSSLAQRTATANTAKVGEHQSSSMAKRSSLAHTQQLTATEFPPPSDVPTHNIHLVAKSFLSETTKANINTALANEGQFFAAPTNLFGFAKESSLVNFEYNGRRLEGKVSYFEYDIEKNSSFTEISFSNSKLKIFERNGYIRGTLADNGKLYQIEGFQDEWSIMEFYQYKRLNNALAHD